MTDTQSYDVTLAITNSQGGLNTIAPLERLSVLPGGQQPLLVELGVLKGGHRVLFAVQPGAVLNGPGNCTPGRIDCEILSLPVDQTEGLSVRTSSGVNQVALFAVTGISTTDHGSVAAADQARSQESAAGRAVLDDSPLRALSLFRYDPSLGVVLDLRNLTVGTAADLGGNPQALSRVARALGSRSLPIPPPTMTPNVGTSSGLTVSLQLMPQAFGFMLTRGVAVRVSSNEAANGFATIAISRRTAKRAGIKTGDKALVAIGTGTVSGVKDGTVMMHLHLSRAVAKQLRPLGYVTLTVHVTLLDSAGKHVSLDVTGSY